MHDAMKLLVLNFNRETICLAIGNAYQLIQLKFLGYFLLIYLGSPLWAIDYVKIHLLI